MTFQQILFCITISFFIFSFQSQASEGVWYNPEMKLKDLEIEIVLTDGASGACWTNLREVREYAEEKLYSRGAKIVKDINLSGNNFYYLNILVSGERISMGSSRTCVGVTSLQLVNFSDSHKIILYEGKDLISLHPTNLNNVILEEVRKKFNDMP